VYLVGGAAGPLGGDDLRLDIDVGPRATLVIRTVAASVALPGPDGRGSRLLVRASVGAGAKLRWLAEPSIAAAGCDHSVCVHVDVDPSATVEWRDEVIAGRSNEEPGLWRSRLVADRGGSPLLRHELSIGAPGWDGPCVLDGGRAAGSVLLVDPDRTFTSRATSRGALLPLRTGAALVTALAGDALELGATLDELARRTADVSTNIAD
jgi:urease accessory protein